MEMEVMAAMVEIMEAAEVMAVRAPVMEMGATAVTQFQEGARVEKEVKVDKMEEEMALMA